MTITARLLDVRDIIAFDALLAPHTPFAFFLRSNMAKGGIVYEGEAYQADYFGAFVDGKLKGILAHSWLGSVQIFAPDEQYIPYLTECWRDRLRQKPRKVSCFIGPAKQVEILRTSIGIRDQDLTAFEDRRREGLFVLDIDDATAIEAYCGGGFKLRRAEVRDTALLIEWRVNFFAEVLEREGTPETRREVEDEIKRRLIDNDMFILELEGRPVSYCGVGGYLPDWRIVGPVWTPPELRGREYGRRVVAAAINMVQQEGVSHVVLFAHNEAGIRAYEAVGFRKIGDWRLDYLRADRTQI